MDSHLYVGRIFKEEGTQPRKAKDSMSVQTLSYPKEAIPNPVFLPVKFHKPIFQELKVP